VSVSYPGNKITENRIIGVREESLFRKSFRRVKLLVNWNSHERIFNHSSYFKDYCK